MDNGQNQSVSPTPGQPATPPVAPSPVGGSSSGTSNGMEQHKLWAILGYILPILFFIPLLSEAKHNAYAKFHANQQLNLLLFWVVTSVVLPMIPFIGWVLMPFCYIAGVVFMIMGVINASQGQLKALPLIGTFALIK